MTLQDLIPDYLNKTYQGKTVAIKYGYDGEFEVHEFESKLELAKFCLEKQAEIWSSGKLIVNFDSDWCQFARDIFNFLSFEDRTKIIKDKCSKNAPHDLFEKYDLKDTEINNN